jgi:hypothetical protein
MTDDPDLDAIVARIRKLAGMTPERGCSEAEARLALEKAAALMRDNDLSALDLVMTHADCRRRVTAGASDKDRLWAAVAHFTNTAAISRFDLDTGRRVLRYYGREPAPEIAAYMRDLLDAAMDFELRQFHKTPAYRWKRKRKTKERAARAFVSGMVMKLARVLADQFDGAHDAAASEQAHQYCDERNPGAVARKPRRAKAGDDAAREAGWRAGGRVEINQGVGGREPVALIGRR